MTVRTPYLLTLLGLAGLAIVAVHRWDGAILAMVLVIAVMAVTGLAWEVHRR